LVDIAVSENTIEKEQEEVDKYQNLAWNSRGFEK